MAKVLARGPHLKTSEKPTQKKQYRKIVYHGTTTQQFNENAKKMKKSNCVVLPVPPSKFLKMAGSPKSLATPVIEASKRGDDPIGQVFVQVIAGSNGFERVAVLPIELVRKAAFHYPRFLIFGYFFTFLAPTGRIPLFKCAWHTHTEKWTHLYINRDRYINFFLYNFMVPTLNFAGYHVFR